MMGVKPIRAVAFETTPEGVRAAKAAGIFCIGMQSKAGVQADMTLVSFLEAPLLQVLEKIDRAKREKFSLLDKPGSNKA